MPEADADPHESAVPRRRLVLPVAALLAWGAATVLLSGRFDGSLSSAEEPIEIFVALQILGGAIWFWTLAALRRQSGARLVLLVVVVGLVLRAAFFFSTPILEDDYQRYLWDGGVVAHGLDPYAHAPADLLLGAGMPRAAWDPLVDEGDDVLQQVNHPHLRTIYPPVAQGAFALAHVIAPWKPLGLRLVWLGLDLIVCLLLLRGLGRASDRAWRLAIYWLNPLLIKEIYNSLHMEMVLLVFATAALVWAGRKRFLPACVALGLAIGAKFWPALWVPLLLRRRGLGKRRLAIGLLVAGAVALACVLPILRGGTGEDSGLSAYASHWEMNDGAFVLLLAFFEWWAGAHGMLLARASVALLVLGVLTTRLKRPVGDGADVTGRALWVVAALFLLSPTAFPWYFLWCLPLLALRPQSALLLLTATLPLYYLRFRFAQHDNVGVFDYGVVWLEFLPTWILLARSGLRARQARTAEAR